MKICVYGLMDHWISISFHNHDYNEYDNSNHNKRKQLCLEQNEYSWTESNNNDLITYLPTVSSLNCFSILLALKE